MLFTVSCSEDESAPVPPLRMEFVEAHTDAAARVSAIKSDSGREYTVGQHIVASVADTTYRCVCSFTLDDSEAHATVYSLQHIYSMPPSPLDDFEELSADPVNVVSVWKGGSYINMVLSVLTTGYGTHSFAFCDNGLVVEDGGVATADVSLLHKRSAEDAESFSQDVYLSMPIGGYAGLCDSMSVSIPTYQGVKKFVFENK